MGSTKGKPTDPKLHDEITEEIKQQTNKDGSGKGQMAAWKASKIAKEYEAQGGYVSITSTAFTFLQATKAELCLDLLIYSGYDNESGSKNEPKKGYPAHKSDAKKSAESKHEEADREDNDNADADEDEEEEQDEVPGDDNEEGPDDDAEIEGDEKEQPNVAPKKATKADKPPASKRTKTQDKQEDEENNAEEQDQVRNLSVPEDLLGCGDVKKLIADEDEDEAEFDPEAIDSEGEEVAEDEE
ncbi:hypothetical protein QFC19_007421 [Naganishia cerealis]|uniref:Uncharacterized protein n=1 Tax=Naganishia cerealis TaxID=610337 RepID=A0ACC2VB59_9TREE|nr:hypothetical protein QFC19_007421 [Naganishia cerealis]